MDKISSLRAYLTTAMPELARHPDRLSISLVSGRFTALYGERLGFGYSATAQIDILGFPGAPAAVFLPVLMWLRVHELAALQNHEIAAAQLRFEADVLDDKTVDISIQIPITEAVDVTERADGSGFDMALRDEPPLADGDYYTDPVTLLRRIWHGETLILGNAGD